MPGSACARARLLGEHVIVVEARLRAAHECCAHRPERRVADEAPVVLVLAPVAEVLDEPARIVARAGHLGARAGVRKVGIDPGAQQLELGGSEQLSQHDHAVAAEGRDRLLRHRIAALDCLHALLPLEFREFYGSAAVRAFQGRASRVGLS